MDQPAYLKPGSTIGIVAPAGVIAPDILENAIHFLEKQGFMVKIGAHVLDNHFQFAASDANRLADLQAMLDDPQVHAILAARGGYGLIRLLPMLNMNGFLRFPKWVCGFSDITALHCLVNQFEIPSIHSCMLACFSGNSEDKPGTQFLFQLLKGETVKYEGRANPFTRTGLVRAPIVGGNLSLLHALRGTAYEPDVEGKILFIEDIGEYLYHIDRMMMNLKLGGYFERISGLILGQFTALKDHDLRFGLSIDELLAEYTRELDIPVITNFPAGHAATNLPILLGKSASLFVSNDHWSLSFD